MFKSKKTPFILKLYFFVTKYFGPFLSLVLQYRLIKGKEDKKRILERHSLEKRADDNEKIAIKRFETYEKNINPIIGFYKQTNLLKVVNGEATISEISDEISDLIEGNKG